MALSQTTIRNQFNKLINLSPNKFIVEIAGTEYTAIKTNLKKSIKYSEFGASNGYEFSIMLNYSDFVTVPVVDSLLTINTVEYRIIGIEQDSVDCTIQLDLGSKYA